MFTVISWMNLLQKWMIQWHSFQSCELNYIHFDLMSFGIESRKLKKIIDLYYPNNHSQEIRYLVYLKGEEELLINLQTCTFQGISNNSIEQRIAAFGSNQIKHQLKPYLSIIRESFSHFRVHVLLIFTLLNAIYSSYLYLQNSKALQLIQSILIAFIVIINAFMSKYEELSFTFHQQSKRKQRNGDIYTVIRENNREQVLREDILVGDLLLFKEDDQIPADGLLIQGNDIIMLQKYTSNVIESKKDTLKMCITEIKNYSQSLHVSHLKLNLNEVKFQKSPVLVSGSTVKSGEGKMIVLCVGKLSRKGEFQKLSQSIFNENILMTKIESLLDLIFLWTFRLSLAYCLIYTIQTILGRSQGSSLLSLKWQYLMNSIYTLFIAIPSGLYFGIFLGCSIIKIKLFWQGISSQLNLNVLKMCLVSQICFSKEETQNNMESFQLWNQHSFKLRRKSLEKDIYEVQQSFQGPVNNNFKNIINEYMRLMKDEEGVYKMGQEYKKEMIDRWTILWKQGQEQRYLCSGDNKYMMASTELNNCQILKSQILNSQNITEYIENSQQSELLQNNDIIKIQEITNDMDDNNYITYIRADHPELLNLCSHMISMSKGILEPLTPQKKIYLINLLKAMNKKLIKVYIVAFALNKDKNNINYIHNLQKNNLTLFCMYGVSQMNDHRQFQTIRKLKEIGINLILTSSRGLQQSIADSQYISFNAIEKDTLAFDGQELMGLVEGIICNTCKRSLCLCQNEFKQSPKIKNHQQFLKITQYLRILYNATYYQKYTLLIGYKNNEKQTAFVGNEEEDLPALANSYLSISAKQSCCKQNSSIIMPSSSINNIYLLIKYSRFAYQFVRKYIQLILPASFVPAFLLLFSGIFFHQQIFTIKQILWVHLFICPVLALSLSLQPLEQDIIEENQSSFSKNSSLITEPMKNQIITQSILQVLVLLILMMTGHLFIPEGMDRIDTVIGVNWPTKYNNEQFNTVASGLYYNPLINTPSYEPSFQAYQLYSRHITLVYNIYVLFQIFNYLNCRKIKVSQINIVEGLTLTTIFIFFSLITCQFFFINTALEAFALYPEGLRTDQWLLSLGMSLLVWVMGFVSKLFGSQGVQRQQKKEYRNKSFKLGVKLLLAKDSKLGQFQMQDDIQYKYT